MPIEGGALSEVEKQRQKNLKEKRRREDARRKAAEELAILHAPQRALENVYIKTKVASDLTTQIVLGFMTGGVSLIFTAPHIVTGFIFGAVGDSAEVVAKRALKDHTETVTQFTVRSALLHGMMTAVGRTPALGFLAATVVADCAGYILKPLRGIPAIFSKNGEETLKKTFNYGPHHMRLTQTAFDITHRTGIFSGHISPEGSYLNREKKPQAPRN